MIALLTQPDMLDRLLIAFLRAMRVTAFVTGLLVIIDSLGLLIGLPEQPPHRPRANAAGWMVGALFTCIATGRLLFQQTGWITASSAVADKISAVMILAGLFVAFTIRATARAKRPAMTLSSAVLMAFFGIVLAMMSPAQ